MTNKPAMTDEKLKAKAYQALYDKLRDRFIIVEKTTIKDTATKNTRTVVKRKLVEADVKSIQATLQILDPGTWKPKTKPQEQPQDSKAKVLKLLSSYEEDTAA